MPTRKLAHLLPAALLLPATLISGCTAINNLNTGEGKNINMAGAGTVLQDTDAYTPDRLAALINCGASSDACPNGQAALQPTPSGGSPQPDPVGPALMNFANQLTKPPATGGSGANYLIANQNRLRDIRNEIQGILLEASNNRCTAFKQRLRYQASNTTFLLGSLATGLGAAGALFTNGTSQILSGLGAGTAGINAEYQHDLLSNLTTNVIVPGIEKQRAAVAQEINNRRCFGITSYPLSLSLADVVRYHAACNLDVGVAAAGDAVSQIHTQSIADVQAALAAFKGLKDSAGETAKKTTTETNNASMRTKNIAGTTSETTPMGSSSPAHGAAAAAKATQAGHNNQPLVGDSTALTECRPLDENGLLPADESTNSGGGTPAKKGKKKMAAVTAPADAVAAMTDATVGQYAAH